MGNLHKKVFLGLFSMFLLNSTSANKPKIVLNQLGFYPGNTKYAVSLSCKEKSNINDKFEIVRSDGKVVMEGSLSKAKYFKDSDENAGLIDFSNLTEEGKYYIKVGNLKSHSFIISDKVWDELSDALLKSYYYQRCSYLLSPSYAGKWSRAEGHDDTVCYVHPSANSDKKIISSPGGWYDAGDYGKYVVNSGITLATLLYVAEYYPQLYPDKSLNIPESGNNVSDLIDEIKFELDWLFTMQDSDGGVFFKLTTKYFCGMVMPDKDNLPRYIIGKTTSSALNFSAVMAAAYRVFKNIDSEYADKCLKSSINAWKWSRKNPVLVFRNPSDISTGEYGDGNLNDEFVWAASELYISTKEKEYSSYLDNNLFNMRVWKNADVSSLPSWANVELLSVISLSKSRENNKYKSECKDLIFKISEIISEQISNSPLRIPDVGYGWGSNSVFANAGWILLVAASLDDNNQKYLNLATDIADYLLGKNPVGISFITGFGTKYVINPHHRPSAADGVEEPIPGFIVGGPNPHHNDKEHVRYHFSLPALSYEDVVESFASNEVAINWNAPAVLLFSVLKSYICK